jgi:NADH-quinone oxidoreductase subunit G
MGTIYVDGKPFEVEEGQNMLQASLSLGFDLPYFCWHPALGSVGACRQCAVKQFKDENDTHGKIVMACMTPASPGTRISIDDPEAKEFRASVIEFLMVNHPHDCPVCDEGGECHLQDMTVMSGHVYREYDFQKRTYPNQYLGPFINHEMNRCIQCYRCVRFYREYAGGRDFNVFAAHDHIYFGRASDGTLENEFSGNLVEVCPTGVFTDKTFKKHFTRKWDLQTAPSICVGCGLGCNIIPGERYGQLRRIRNRFNREVNGYFLCDRGRYGYEFVNSEQRLRNPLQRVPGGEPAKPIAKDAALQFGASLLEKKGRVIGIGSPRASLEDNFALREMVGAENFYLGFSIRDHQLILKAIQILQDGTACSPSIHDAERSDMALILGEDLTNTAPRLALALRQLVHRQASKVAKEVNIPAWNDIAIREVIQHEPEQVIIATPYSTKLDDVAVQTYHAAPDDLARLGFAVAHALNPAAPEVPDLPQEVQALAETIAERLNTAELPLVISGTSSGSEALLEAAANVAWALCENQRCAQLGFIVPEANSMGLALLGGGNLQEAFRALQDGSADTLVVLEDDLYRRVDAPTVDAALSAARHVIVIDYLNSPTTRKADLVLPAATFAESSGTLVNNEGRAQRFYQVFEPRDGAVQAGWRWVRDLMQASPAWQAENPANWQDLDEIGADLAAYVPAGAVAGVAADVASGAIAGAGASPAVNAAADAGEFAGLVQIAPPASFRIVGQRIPRQSPRYSGRTALQVNLDGGDHHEIQMHEPKPPADPDSPLAFSMEGFEGQPPSPLIPRFWTPGWNSVQSVNKFESEVAGPLQGGDPGLRLIQPAEGLKKGYFREFPPAFNAQAGLWLAIPVAHIFGSEPLSMLSPGIAERAPLPYVALNPADARSLQVGEGQSVRLTVSQQVYELPVHLLPTLPQGLAGLPAGLPQIPCTCLPAWSKIVRSVENE